jgi:hypothetical protein
VAVATARSRGQACERTRTPTGRRGPDGDGAGGEDEIEIARIVRDYLRNAGFEVIVVGDGGLAVASVRSAKPDLLVLDWASRPGRPRRRSREIRRWSTP